MHAQAPEVDMVDCMTEQPAKQDTRSYSDRVSGAKYELMRIDRITQMFLHHYCWPVDGVLDPNSISCQRVRARVDTAAPKQHWPPGIPYIIVDMIALHTRVDRITQQMVWEWQPAQSIVRSTHKAEGACTRAVYLVLHARTVSLGACSLR